MAKVVFDERILKKRNRKSQLFGFTVGSIIVLSFILLAWLLLGIIRDAIGWLDWQFLSSFPSRKPENAGMFPGIIGSLILLVIVALFAVPVGLGAAIYLEEYANKKGLFYKIIDISISNLSGVPTIIYGILGISLFTTISFLKGTILSGGIVLGLLILPVIIVSAQEALKAVPSSLKEAAYGLGMTKWQVIVAVVFPYALPGMMTGIILALSRAIGEAAPLIVIGAATIVTRLPRTPLSSFTAMPIQIFYWTGLPKEDFTHVAAAGSLVLLFILLSFNSMAIYLRNKFQKKL